MQHGQTATSMPHTSTLECQDQDFTISSLVSEPMELQAIPTIDIIPYDTHVSVKLKEIPMHLAYPDQFICLTSIMYYCIT